MAEQGRSTHNMRLETSIAIALVFIGLLLATSMSWASQQYAVSGLVLKMDRPRGVFVVSCTPIPGYKDGMAMSFSVRKPESLDGVEPSAMVEFVLHVDGHSSYADDLQV